MKIGLWRPIEFTHLPSLSQITRLEQDALEVLRLVRSIKNRFAPISRIPPELLSLIPRYWDKDPGDNNLIVLTHVCRGWRDIFTAYSSLWTHLDCSNIGKTCAYIERSKSSPLEISLHEYRNTYYRKDVFLLAIPHIDRVTSINVFGGEKLLQDITEHLSCPVPLLRNVTINITCSPPPVLSSRLFGSDLSSLRTLNMSGVVPHLPWKNIPRLTTFVFRHASGHRVSVTPLLDFFANAPSLCEVELGSIPDSSDAPPGRVVSLPSLKSLTILADSQPSSILLSHLSIPTRASLYLEIDLCDPGSLFQKFIPNTTINLQNISTISSVCIDFGAADISIQLNGRIGGVSMLGYRSWSMAGPTIPDSAIIRSLDYFALSRVQRLAITMYDARRLEETDTAHHHFFDTTKHLRTLFLNQSNNRPFILALNPDESPAKQILCPELEGIFLYIEDRKSFDIEELDSMARERALVGAKLHSLRVVCQNRLVPEEELFRLREHVAHVECRVVKSLPRWDSILDE